MNVQAVRGVDADAEAARAAALLVGFGDDEVRSRMARIGLTEADVHDGWGRLRRYLASKRARRGPGFVDRATVERLDAWYARWRPVAEEVLKDAPPLIATWVLGGLGEASGPDAIVPAGRLAGRLAALVHGTPADRVVMARLAERGLTGALLEGAREDLAELGRACPHDPVDAEREAEREAAAGAMIDFACLWSALAFVALDDPRHLRAVGLEAPRGDEALGVAA